jgi:cytochrome c
VHVQPGAFYGSYSVNPDVTRKLPITPPTLWLPVEDIAYSPSQPLALNLGPYKNQMLYADVTYGGLNRVVMQKVNGAYQGCALPFIQGLEAGVNRAGFGPDGNLYVGGIGNPGNWAQEGKLWYGLQRLEYTAAPAFEMLDVAIHSNGVQIDFTEPLHVGDGEHTTDYAVSQWHYVPTSEYGGPKVGEHSLGVQSVYISPDRRRVFLTVDGLEKGQVLRVHLAQPPMSSSNRELWAGDAYCTVNQLPTDARVQQLADHRVSLPNTLNADEERSKTHLLFDGKSLDSWLGADGKRPRGWVARDGWLTAIGSSGTDLVTPSAYADFELDFEWRANAGSNGGVFYRIPGSQTETWRAAVEYQVLDDKAHADGAEPLHRSAAAYDLFAPQLDVVRPAGEANRARIVARGSRVEHWLNGHRVLQYDTSTQTWKSQLQSSKFKAAAFGTSSEGKIGLQHHGEGISYRNIKLRTLAPVTIR